MNITRKNGYKIYTLLIEYSSLTGQPTGRVKPNVPNDPDYIPPVYDPVICSDNYVPAYMDIIVEIADGFNVDIKLLFGEAEVVRSTSGTWTIALRTYDSVIFQVNTARTLEYKMRIEYGSGQVKETVASGIGGIFINGPFPSITKLKIGPSIEGDYNTDYAPDFFK